MKQVENMHHCLTADVSCLVCQCLRIPNRNDDNYDGYSENVTSCNKPKLLQTQDVCV